MKGCRKSRFSKPVKLLIFVLIVLLILFGWYCHSARKIAGEILTDEIHAAIIDVVNKSNEVLQGLDVMYDDYFTVHYDESGAIDSLYANTGLINQINMIVQTEIQNRLDGLRTMTVSLPIGALSGSPYLSKFGLTIPLQAQVVSNCRTVLRSEFSEMGINNTLHRLQIDCLISVNMIVPSRSFSEEISNEILVAETVIAGKVPSTYLGENTKTDYLDLLPN